MSATCFMVDEISDLWHDGGDLDIGAMTWRRHGLLKYDTTPRPMPHLAVMTPGGIACLDCPATDPPHGYWTRTGTPPNVTVTPSLDISSEPKWHGFLTDGVLTP